MQVVSLVGNKIAAADFLIRAITRMRRARHRYECLRTIVAVIVVAAALVLNVRCLRLFVAATTLRTHHDACQT